MSPIWIITGKEVRDSLRNRWVLAATLLLAALALSLGFLGSSPTGSVKADPLTITVVSLSSLSIFLIPLIAMLLAYDAVIGEIERGTMALLLSYPVSRWQVLVGKFIGHLIILTLATTAGYGLAGIALQLAHGGLDIAAWKPFALLIAASVLLGAGRQKKGDPLDFAAGITLHKKRGDYVKKGESLATFYGAADKFEAAAAEYRSGLGYGPEKPEEAPLVYALVTKDGVARY